MNKSLKVLQLVWWPTDWDNTISSSYFNGRTSILDLKSLRDNYEGYWSKWDHK
jgi:hypothetical protein